MSRATRRPLHLALIAGLACSVLAACGGSSSKSATSEPRTTSSGAGGTSTTKPELVTVPATDPTLAKAALTLGDVGPGYENYRKGVRGGRIGPVSCLVSIPGAVLAQQDSAYGGAMFRKKGATYFAYSTVFVFRTEAQARQFAAFRNGSAYKQCQAKADDAATRKSDPDLYVKLTPVAWSDPSGHVPSMYREVTGNKSAGGDSGFYDRYTVRRGRVVIVVSVDSELGRNDAESEALSQQTGDILRSFDAALDTRLAGA